MKNAAVTEIDANGHSATEEDTLSDPFDDFDVDVILGPDVYADSIYYAEILETTIESLDISRSSKMKLKLIQKIMQMVTIDSTRLWSCDVDEYNSDMIDYVVDTAKSTSHPLVEARLLHVAWKICPSKGKFGFSALRAYIKILRMIANREVRLENGNLDLNTARYEILCLAYGILSKLKFPKKSTKRMDKIAWNIYYDLVAIEDTWNIRKFVKFLIKNSNIECNLIADRLIEFVSRQKNDTLNIQHAYILRLAARAYEYVGNGDGVLNCRKSELDILMRLSEGDVESSEVSRIEKLYWKQIAISNCSNELVNRGDYNRLSDSISKLKYYVSEDLQYCYKKATYYRKSNSTQEFFHLSCSDALFDFTVLEESQDPKRLLSLTKDIMSAWPVFEQLGGAAIDGSNNVAVKSCTEHLDKINEFEKYAVQIDHIERVRRFIVCRDKIDPCRFMIGSKFRISRFFLREIFCYSPVVPDKLVDIFADGFERYFKGDITAAFYILTPLLEGIVRQSLFISGVDVTTYSLADGTQKDRTISGIFDDNKMRKKLVGVIGSEFVFDIEQVFLKEGGPVLRHGLAHSLLDDDISSSFEARYSCWLVWRLSVLPLIGIWDNVFDKNVS